MGGKQPNASQSIVRTPTGPAGPRVAGPVGGAILSRILGPGAARAASNFEQTRETAANTVGTVASIISNLFYPGTGAFASIAANRTVREQLNTMEGRPFFESTDEPLKDWPAILGSLVGSYGLGAVGNAAGGAVGGTTGAAAGSAAGSFVGSKAGSIGGGAIRRELYGAKPSRYAPNPYARPVVYSSYRP